MAPKLSVNIHHDDADFSSTAINFSTTGQNTVIAGVTGQIIRVYRVLITVGASTNLTIQDGNNNLTGAMAFASDAGLVLDFDTKPWFTTSIGNSFNINQSGTAQISGTIYYTQGN